MSITGEMPIGVLAVRRRQGVARALSFAVNAEIEPDFALGGAMEVARADLYGRTSLADALYPWSTSRRAPTLSRTACSDTGKSPTFSKGHCDDDTQHR